MRERLVSCLARGGAPTPLLVDVSRREPLSGVPWRIVAAAALALEIVLWWAGFGDAGSALALHPPTYIGLHAAAIFVILLATLRALRRVGGRGHGPGADGRYLFPLDLVEVDGETIRVTDLHTLRRVEARSGAGGQSIALVFADAHEIVFAWQPVDASLADSVKADVDAALALVLPGDQARLSRIDPFFELRVADDWAIAEIAGDSRRSLLARAPMRGLVAAALVVSALAGASAHVLRERLSDDAMFARAIAFAPGTLSSERRRVGPYTGTRHVEELDTIGFQRARNNLEALTFYRKHGGLRLDEAEDAIFALVKDSPELLVSERWNGGLTDKRADDQLFELRKDDSAALARELQPRTRYADRADDRLFELAHASGEARLYRLYLENGKRHVDEATRELPDAAFREAMASDDAGVLGAFVRDFPANAKVGELRIKIHALYADALHTYAVIRPPPAALRFATALLAELESRNDPSVSLVVNIGDDGSIAAADAPLSLRYGGDYLTAATRFDMWTLNDVETSLSAEMGTWVTRWFPHGTVKLVVLRRDDKGAGPRIVLDCTAIVVPSKDDVPALPDVRFRLKFQGIIADPAARLTWEETTRRALVGAEDRGAVQGRDAAKAIYDQMAIEGKKQVLELIRHEL